MPPVAVAGGGSVQVRMKTAKRPFLKQLQLKLYQPPAGITLDEVKVVPEGLAFMLKADKEMVQPGLTDNLIVEAVREVIPKNKDGKQAKRKQRNSMGILPAIPIQVVDATKEAIQEKKT